MSLVPSLLQAIVGVDGEALVMHAGDKPYVVAPSGQIELASRGLTLEAVNGIVSQLLPPDALSSLDEFGAIQQELAGLAEFPGESFTVVAARGGDDVWVEIRRRKVSDDDQVPDDFFAATASAGAAGTAPADRSQTNTGELQPPANGDYSDIDDVGPLGQPRGSKDVAAAGAGDEDIAIDLGDLDVPDAAQLFEASAAPVATLSDDEAAPELAGPVVPVEIRPVLAAAPSRPAAPPSAPVTPPPIPAVSVEPRQVAVMPQATHPAVAKAPAPPASPVVPSAAPAPAAVPV